MSSKKILTLSVLSFLFGVGLLLTAFGLLRESNSWSIVMMIPPGIGMVTFGIALLFLI